MRQVQRRGGALVLSVLMLVAMTGLGLLAVTSARMEVIVAGNYRTLKQAQYLAEAGLIAAGMQIQNNPASFVRRVKGADWTAVRWDSQMFGNNRVFVQTDEHPGNQSLGWDARADTIDFEVRLESLRDLPACPGSSGNAVCCLKVALVSEGRVGRFDENGVPAAEEQGAKSRVRAEYAVPYPCTR